ncbi:hypothetical protein MMC28_000081 [Mycoblastus sanguinarius]|nr:hypothetical protein [Mycoblastus sanguinarius]
MSVTEIECSGMHGPDAFDTTPSPTGSPDPALEIIRANHEAYKNFKVVGSSLDNWSPERRRIAQAEQGAAQIALSEKLERERPWAANTGPEPGASYDDTRVYTHTKEGGYRYWGVREPGMSIQQFWAIHDPENSRNLVCSQVTEEKDTSISGGCSGQRPKTSIKTTAKSKRSQQKAGASSKYEIKKSTRPSLADKRNTRRSLAKEIENRHANVLSLAQNNRDQVNSSKRPIQSRGSVKPPAAKKPPNKIDSSKPTVYLPQISTQTSQQSRSRGSHVPRANPSSLAEKIQENVVTAPLLPRKRHQGRTSTKPKSARKASKEQKTQAVRGEPRVSKARKLIMQSSMPSHPMRTRAKGPADELQLP